MFNRKRFNSGTFNPVLQLYGSAVLTGAGNVVAKAVGKLTTTSSVNISSLAQAQAVTRKIGVSSQNAEMSVNALPVRLKDGFGATGNIDVQTVARGSVKLIGGNHLFVSSAAQANGFLFTWKKETVPQDTWSDQENEQDIWTSVQSQEKEWRVRNA
jgi:hypothetical protein